MNTKMKTQKVYKNKLLTPSSPFAITEAYRTLRTNLLYSGHADKTAVYAVTSAAPNEGKTLNCANIAISFAQLGKRVLIIDLDMRNPSQHKTFSLQNVGGTSEFLAGVSEVPNVQKTLYENLHLMCAGRIPPDPSELLYSDRFKTLIEMAKQKYDVVFLDLPPAGLVSDAAIIAGQVTGYIMVFEADVSDSRVVLEAISTIETAKGNILGCVLNGVDPKHNKGYNSKYNYYYS